MRNARSIRKAKRLSLEQVARDVDMPFSNLAGFERGENNLGVERLQRLARYYDCTMEDLLSDEPDAAALGDGGSAA